MTGSSQEPDDSGHYPAPGIPLSGVYAPPSQPVDHHAEETEPTPAGEESDIPQSSDAASMESLENRTHGVPGSATDETTSSAAQPPGTSLGGDQAELYSELFGIAPAPLQERNPESPRPHLNQPQPPLPGSPVSLAESGLTAGQVCELILKQLYLHGALRGVDIARNACLPFQVIDECLRLLKDDHCVEVSSGDMIGRVSYTFHLTETGRTRAKEAFDFCRYVGPAPVPLTHYVEQCRRQTVTGINCTPEALIDAFEDLIIRPELLAELGPALCSGKSIFLYGPPGNGKSQIAKGLGRFLNQHGGDIYVPYAIQTENNIITVFDPSLHQTVDDETLSRLLGHSRGNSHSDAHSPQSINHLLHENHADLRWRRIQRPVVVTGGELTLEMLDLRFNRMSNFYVAPLQVKANGGVFMIDDFGRQLVTPRDLLNRWILPLEERIDFVTLATGKKLPVPFEQLTIFSTNLDPTELCDDAFLRRIRHKIKIDTPTREIFTEIFSATCAQHEIPFDAAAVDFLYASHYDQGRSPRSSDPRDLLEIINAICRFRKEPPVLTQELMQEATQQFFSGLTDGE